MQAVGPMRYTAHSWETPNTIKEVLADSENAFWCSETGAGVDTLPFCLCNETHLESAPSVGSKPTACSAAHFALCTEKRATV